MPKLSLRSARTPAVRKNASAQPSCVCAHTPVLLNSGLLRYERPATNVPSLSLLPLSTSCWVLQRSAPNTRFPASERLSFAESVELYAADVRACVNSEKLRNVSAGVRRRGADLSLGLSYRS